jgi:hypothetical protein
VAFIAAAPPTAVLPALWNSVTHSPGGMFLKTKAHLGPIKSSRPSDFLGSRQVRRLAALVRELLSLCSARLFTPAYDLMPLEMPARCFHEVCVKAVFPFLEADCSDPTHR